MVIDANKILIVQSVIILGLAVYVVLRDVIHGKQIGQLLDTIGGFLDNPTVLASIKALDASVPQAAFVAALSILNGGDAILPEGDLKRAVDMLIKAVKNVDQDSANDVPSAPPADPGKG